MFEKVNVWHWYSLLPPLARHNLCLIFGTGASWFPQGTAQLHMQSKQLPGAAGFSGVQNGRWLLRHTLWVVQGSCIRQLWFYLTQWYWQYMLDLGSALPGFLTCPLSQVFGRVVSGRSLASPAYWSWACGWACRSSAFTPMHTHECLPLLLRHVVVYCRHSIASQCLMIPQQRECVKELLLSKVQRA